MSSPQIKEKRGVVSARRRRSLLLLVTDLQLLQTRYPELRQEIQNNIDDHLRQAARTRAAGRTTVLDRKESLAE
jgi:hypothetical protein